MSEDLRQTETQIRNDSAPSAPPQRIPPLLFVGGLLLALCLPPVFCIVALRRWKNVSRRVLIAALIVSCVYAATWTLMAILSGRLPKGSPQLDLIGWVGGSIELPLAFLLSIAYMRRRAIKASRFLIGGAVFLVFMWVLGSAAFLWLYAERTAGPSAKLGKAVQQRLDAIRSAGYPVTAQDLTAWYPKIPDAENAAPIYREAFKHFSGEAPAMNELPAIGDPWPQPLRQEIEKLLAANGPTLELLHKAAGYARCQYDLNFAAKWEMKLPHIALIRRSSRLLTWDAALAVETGAPDRAVADIESLIGLARSLHREPVFYSQLARLGVLNATGWNLQDLLARTALDEKQLAMLYALLQAESDEYAFARALVAERCTGISTFLDMKRDTPRSDRETQIYLRNFFETDFAYYLNVMGGLIHEAESPLPERVAIHEEMSKLRDEPPEGSMVSAMVLPVLYRIAQEERVDITLLRAALCALGVERYRLKHSRLPDRIEEIVPEFLESVPVDARHQRPLGYEKAEKGFIIFIAGKDGKPEPLTDKQSTELNHAEHQAGILFKVAR